MTNGEAIRKGSIPCETNPTTGDLSRTTEQFHARAVVTAGGRKGQLRHVCQRCAERHHGAQKHRAGVLWS